MQLPVCWPPHGVTVVDADVFPLLDVDRCSNHDPVVAIKVFARVVDAGVFQNGDIGVQSLRGCWSDWNLKKQDEVF